MLDHELRTMIDEVKDGRVAAYVRIFARRMLVSGVPFGP